jgi:hypothetical protein
MDELDRGSRIEVKNKKHLGEFVLWKPASEAKYGQALEVTNCFEKQIMYAVK